MSQTKIEIPDVEGEILTEPAIRALLEKVGESYRKEIVVLRERVAALEKVESARVAHAVRDHRQAFAAQGVEHDRRVRDAAGASARIEERARHAEAALAAAEKRLAAAVAAPPPSFGADELAALKALAAASLAAKTAAPAPAPA